ncbi:MAG: hypothetical protein E7467_03590 [Ruminococcaceae bacterium]|nr:hypothetical protein [Oscillospiraceae bacterium]
MTCANCGRTIPQGKQICPHCDDSAKDYSQEIKSVKPRINKDMLECPICSMKGISPKERSCPQCKIKFIQEQWVCDSCKAQNRYQTVKCVHCAKVRNSSGKLEQAKARKGMAFYQYLIYFGLFASAALSFYSGCMTIVENGLLGFYYLLYGVFALVARFLLASRKRDGLKLYIGMLWVDCAVTLLSIDYFQDMISSETSKVIDTYGEYASQAAVSGVNAISAGGQIGVLIGSLIAIGINGVISKYFTNREDYFNQ